MKTLKLLLLVVIVMAAVSCERFDGNEPEGPKAPEEMIIGKWNDTNKGYAHEQVWEFYQNAEF